MEPPQPQQPAVIDDPAAPPALNGLAAVDGPAALPALDGPAAIDGPAAVDGPAAPPVEDDPEDPPPFLPLTIADYFDSIGGRSVLEELDMKTYTDTRANPQLAGQTTTHDPLITNAVVLLSADTLCLEGQPFHPDIWADMVHEAQTAPTAASQKKLRHVHRHAQQFCDPDLSLSGVATISFIGLPYAAHDSSDAHAPPVHLHPSESYPSRAGTDGIPHHHTIRMVQLGDYPDDDLQQCRVDGDSMHMSEAVYELVRRADEGP